MNYIICYGNPVDGFTFVGPFDDRDEAVRYAEFDGEQGTDWCIAEVHAPAEPEADQFMTQEEYLKTGGQLCPRCRSSNISASDSQVDGSSAWQQIECGTCGLVYQDVFNLVAYHVEEK